MSYDALPADIITGERSECIYCGQDIGAVIDGSSGCFDWGSSLSEDDSIEDFGCDSSPDTDEDGTGSHNPGEGHTEPGFRVLIDSASYWQQVEAHRARVGPDAYDRGAR